MPATSALPRAVRPLVEFPALLRAHGFAIAPDQTIGFVEAVGLLGPRSLADIRRAGIAMMAIPREREPEFDALFRAFFLGQTLSAPALGDEDDEVEAHEPEGGSAEAEEGDDIGEVGARATAAERLTARGLESAEDAALTRFARLAPARLPRRRSYRYGRARKGALDFRRTLRAAARRDGEAIRLLRRRRKARQRRVVLLIDISGSMKERTDERLAFAHTLARAADLAEVFTLGTRLTRITADLRGADRERALARVSRLVADFDGGTRIGEALQTFLAVPRYAGFARGALVIVLSDGLERGDPTAMVEATRRLSRMAWRLDWLSPLAADPAYRPETAGLAALTRDLAALGDGSGTGAIVDHVLRLERRA
ncbi:MAG: VWA domain-containing protein [Pseudomonadota bacterium]